MGHWFFEKLLDPLGLFGLAAQAVFMFRFMIQWFASEKRGRSYVPVAFWYASVLGGVMTFVYATLRKDPVFMLAQVLGIAIYVRNLMLIYRRRNRVRGRSILFGNGALADAPGEPTAHDSSAPG